MDLLTVSNFVKTSIGLKKVNDSRIANHDTL